MASLRDLEETAGLLGQQANAFKACWLSAAQGHTNSQEILSAFLLTLTL